MAAAGVVAFQAVGGIIERNTMSVVDKDDVVFHDPVDIGTVETTDALECAAMRLTGIFKTDDEVAS